MQRGVSIDAWFPRRQHRPDQDGVLSMPPEVLQYSILVPSSFRTEAAEDGAR